MARLDIDRQLTLEPIRMKSAKDFITKLGYEITLETDKELDFEFKGCIIKFFPYSGWHSGGSIKDGRGLKKLLKQISL